MDRPRIPDASKDSRSSMLRADSTFLEAFRRLLLEVTAATPEVAEEEDGVEEALEVGRAGSSRLAMGLNPIPAPPKCPDLMEPGADCFRMDRSKLG